MAIGTYQQIVTLDETDGAGGVRPLDPPTWYGAPIAEGGGLVTLVGHYHAGITTATRVHFKGRTFHVDGVLDRGGRGFQTQITCQEVFDAGAAVPVGPSYADLVIADGASHYWRLDDTGGVALDRVGGATGTISGGVTKAQPGALTDGNAAMTFDGTTGKIVTAMAVTLPVAYTCEAWLRFTATGQRAVFSNRDTGGTVFIGTFDGYLYFYNGLGPLSVATCHDGQWHHVVWVVSGTTLTYYLDGAFDKSGPIVAPVTEACVVTLGRDGGLFWSGSLDDVAIYPHALTAAQLLAHYTAGTT